MFVYIYIHIYIYIERERQRDIERDVYKQNIMICEIFNIIPQQGLKQTLQSHNQLCHIRKEPVQMRREQMRRDRYLQSQVKNMYSSRRDPLRCHSRLSDTCVCSNNRNPLPLNPRLTGLLFKHSFSLRN